MPYYVANGNVYFKDEDGKVHGVDVTAKDKVIEHRELESITPVIGKKEVALPAGAHAATLDEIALKFNLSELNPIKFKESAKKTTTE